MILISNHLLTLPEFSEVDPHIVIRINLSYVKDEEELRRFLSVSNDVFLDYPKGRMKPPVPNMDYKKALEVATEFDNVKYFAVSNIESEDEVNKFKGLLPEGIKLVPKIETIKGVSNFSNILDCGIEYIMLDAEDLYTSAANQDVFLMAQNMIQMMCKERGIELLELYGVVFKA